MGRCSKTIRFLMVLALISASFAASRSALRAPALQNSITSRSGTRPVSSYQNSLIRTPNPISNNGNLIVTGNVGGGKHFRGTVPYNAISDFGGRLGTGTLDNFLRRSTVSSNYYTGDITPYYSYTGTVTRIVPGTTMVVNPTTSRIRTDSGVESGTFINLQKQSRPGKLPTSNLTPTGRIVFAPIGDEESEKTLDTEFLKEPAGLDRERSELYKVDDSLELKDFNKRVEELRKEAEELESQLLQQRTKDKEEDEQLTEEAVPDYDKAIEEYQENKEIYDELYPDEAEKELDQEPTLLDKLSERKLEYREDTATSAAGPAKTQETKEEETDFSEQGIESRARVAEEAFDSLTSETNTKYERYFASALENMQNGNFYQAAKDYSFATLYKPSDPAAYAGQGHALFAAGEYVSSAININRAIELAGNYTDVKADIVEQIGDKDTVEKRLADIDNWYGVTSSPELKFLQAYIYMQMDRFDMAKEAIKAAQTKMDDVPAVNILAQAIENSAK